MDQTTLRRVEDLEAELGDPVRPPADTYSCDVIVKAVVVRDDRWDIESEDVSGGGGSGGFSVLMDDLPWPKRDVAPPRPGDRMTLYLHNGWKTVGFGLRGERLFVRSEREMTLRWLLFRACTAREREA